MSGATYAKFGKNRGQPSSLTRRWIFSMVVWRSGSALVSIIEVNLRRARLVLGWVTVSGFNSRCATFISVCDQPPWSTQPGHPFVVGAMSTSQRVVTPRGWGLRQVAGKTAWSPCYTRALSERFRDTGLTYKVLYNFICSTYDPTSDILCGWEVKRLKRAAVKHNTARVPTINSRSNKLRRN